MPRGAQRSRKLVKSAGSQVTNTPKERIGTRDFAKHLLDDTIGVTQADNLARATRLLHSRMPKVSIEIEASGKRRLHQVVGVIVNSTWGGPRRLQEWCLVRRVSSTKKKEFTLDEDGQRVSPEGAARSLDSPVWEGSVELTLPPKELSRPMVSPTRMVSRVPMISYFLKTQPPGQAAKLQDTMLGRITRETSKMASPAMDSTQDPDSKGVNAEVRQLFTSDRGRALHIVHPRLRDIPGHLGDSSKEAEFEKLDTTQETGGEQPPSCTPKGGRHDSSAETKESSAKVDSFASQLRTPRPKVRLRSNGTMFQSCTSRALRIGHDAKDNHTLNARDEDRIPRSVKDSEALALLGIQRSQCCIASRARHTARFPGQLADRGPRHQ